MRLKMINKSQKKIKIKVAVCDPTSWCSYDMEERARVRRNNGGEAAKWWPPRGREPGFSTCLGEQVEERRNHTPHETTRTSEATPLTLSGHHISIFGP